MVVGTTGFGLQTPASLGGFTLTVVLSIAAVFAIGLLITGVARTAVAAGGFGWVTFFPLMFFAGLWVPLQELPGAVRQISHYTPLGASVQALQHSIQNGFPAAAPSSSSPPTPSSSDGSHSGSSNGSDHPSRPQNEGAAQQEENMNEPHGRDAISALVHERVVTVARRDPAVRCRTRSRGFGHD
jgi:hypothetical protein